MSYIEVACIAAFLAAAAWLAPNWRWLLVYALAGAVGVAGIALYASSTRDLAGGMGEDWRMIGWVMLAHTIELGVLIGAATRGAALAIRRLRRR